MIYKERKIEMNGTPNFRDLGGIFNKDGKKVCSGLIFRSGSLGRLNTNDWRRFSDLGIKKVIDFRTPGEIKNDPDNIPTSLHVTYVQSTIGNPADMENFMMSPRDIRKEHALTFTIDGYKKFIHSIKDFRPVFDALSTSDENGNPVPFLFHCMAGKDRTGIAAALLLSALNVDREVIFEDYLLSNEYALPYFRNNKEELKLSEFQDEVIEIIGGVDKDYLQASFELIEEMYGDVNNLLEKTFDLTDKKREEIIDRYTC